MFLVFAISSVIKAQSTTKFETGHNDSVWFDPVSGERVHKLRLATFDTLVVTRQQPFKAIAVDLGINAGILAWDHFVQKREWAKVTFNVINNHFKRGFCWDGDSFSGNQFSHPYHGGLFYNAARQHGMSYGVSLLYPLLGSFTWEMFCERNRPAINDLLSTGIGGAAFGEVTHRTSDIFFDNSERGTKRVAREIIGSLLNPVRGIQRMISGEMWRVSPYRGKHIIPEPYSFSVTAGVRHMSRHSNLNNGMDIPYMNFAFSYGDRFDSVNKNHPYDWFTLNILANLSPDHPTIGEMDIIGRIASRQIHLKNGWKMDAAFYQTVKYVDNYGEGGRYSNKHSDYPVISEAVSFGGGLYAEKTSTHTSVNNDFIFSAVILGGTNTDYFTTRRYNFSTGFSIRNNSRFSLNKKFTIGNNLYVALLFTPDGYTPEEYEEIIQNNHEANVMGDKGCSTVIVNRAYANANITSTMKIDFSYIIYHRNSNYTYYPNVNKDMGEYRIGLSYSF